MVFFTLNFLAEMRLHFDLLPALELSTLLAHLNQENAGAETEYAMETMQESVMGAVWCRWFQIHHKSPWELKLDSMRYR